MQYKTIFSVCGLIGCLASTSAFAVATDQSGVTHKATHRHHVARVHNTNTMTDVPQESAAPEVKPETPPEYFGHAVGSDGGGS